MAINNSYLFLCTVQCSQGCKIQHLFYLFSGWVGTYNRLSESWIGNQKQGVTKEKGGRVGSKVSCDKMKRWQKLSVLKLESWIKGLPQIVGGFHQVLGWLFFGLKSQFSSKILLRWSVSPARICLSPSLSGLKNLNNKIWFLSFQIHWPN